MPLAPSTQAAETGYDFDISRFPTVDALPFAENTGLQQILDATVKLAQDDLTNVTQTIGFITPDGKCEELTKAYQKTCDFAFQKVVNGAQDYTFAIRDATRQLAEKGIRTIDYESGVHTSLEAAVRRNIMGGLGLMNERITQQNHDDLGCDGWEISAHGGCAPDHEPIQGKQYSDAAFTRLNNSLVRRIGTLNCGHSAMPIIMGVNEPQYTAEELEEFRQQNEAGIDFEGKHYTLYEATQRQRSLERSIRKTKRKILIDESTGDAEKLQWDQIRLVRTREEYHRFSKAAGLPEQFERMEKAGFTWKHGKAAEKAAKKSVANSVRSGTMEAERNMANGLRRSYFIDLTPEDKEYILREVDAIGADRSVFVFRDGQPTSYSDKRDVISVSSSVFPSDDGSTHPADLLSVRATLAHEYYGHRAHRGTKLGVSAWNDEFRASYTAARDCPNLTDEDRAMLIADAMQRAKDAGVNIKLNSFMRRLLYGYE